MSRRWLLFPCVVPVLGGLLEPRASVPDCNTATYKDIAVYGINTHRGNHSVADLAWNQTLADMCASTATNGALGVHDNAGKGYGQNLYYGWPESYGTVGHAISWWYNDEEENYNKYGNAAIVDSTKPWPQDTPAPAKPNAEYLHFTQLVWKNTKTVGCYSATRHDIPNGSGGTTTGTYTCCDFYPSGNWVDSDHAWKDNVLPPLGQAVVGPVC